jgi:hypothetical protein
MAVNRLHDRDVRRLNRRVGWLIVATLLVLYLVAIVGVITLN